MSEAMQRLYPPVIRDHSRHPRLAELPANADATAAGDNPLCGDTVEVGLRVENARLAAIGHHTQGCALCVAAASTMSETLLGATVDEVFRLDQVFRRLIHHGTLHPGLDMLNSFAGVAAFPMRRQCVVLPWDVLRAALAKRP